MRRGGPASRAAASPAWRCLAGAVAGAAALAAGPVAAGETGLAVGEGVAPPPRFGAPAIGLEDAVRLTLEHDPALASARQQVAGQQGAWQEARGTFDAAVLLNASGAYDQGELLGSDIVREQKRRDTFRLLFESLEGSADRLDENLSAVAIDFAACLFRGGTLVTVDTGQVRGTFCFDFTGDSPALVQRDNGDVKFLEDALDTLIALGFPDLAAIRDRLQELVRSEQEELRDTFLTTANGLRRGLALLGDIPAVEIEKRLSLDLRLALPSHTGALLAAGLVVEGLEDNFRGKSLSPALGGKGVPTTFRTIAGLTLDIPLGKGRGRVSAAAPERAAQLGVASAQETLRQAAAAAALDTVAAYWRLAAAQATAAVLEHARTLQMEVVTISEELVAADQLPAADLARVRARHAELAAAAAQARLEVLDARLALASEIGLAVESLADAPLATDALPAAPAPEALPAFARGSLVRQAASARGDVLGARSAAAAAEVLARAARADLKRRFDLSLLVAYNGLAESLTRNFYDLQGFSDSVSGGLTGPSYIASLTFELPLRNDRAAGRLVQADALGERSRIAAADLERRAGLGAVEDWGAVRGAAAEAARRRAALDAYEQTLTAAIERYRAGEVGVVDTVLTEQQTTTARLDRVAAEAKYATLLARFRFEVGALLATRVEGSRLSLERFDPLGLALSVP